MNSQAGNGHEPTEVPRFYRASTIDAVATALGCKLEARVVARFPWRYRAELEAWIRREGKTGNFSIGFSEGHETWIIWEETR